MGARAVTPGKMNLIRFLDNAGDFVSPAFHGQTLRRCIGGAIVDACNASTVAADVVHASLQNVRLGHADL